MLQPKKTVKKYVPTAKEKKNLDDASKNINMRPPFTPEERKKMPKVGNMGSAKSGASLKAVPSDKVGLSKLPTPVRNKMGYQKNGGAMKAQNGAPIKKFKSAEEVGAAGFKKDTTGKFTKSIKPKAKNGKSFPDLNKDGKITKADILKGRGVIAKKGASVKKMQYGGKAASMVPPMKSGGKMKKCKYGCN